MGITKLLISTPDRKKKVPVIGAALPQADANNGTLTSQTNYNLSPNTGLIRY